MVPQELVLNTICRQSPAAFDELKHILLLGYLSFSILDEEKVTERILAEKVCDYFTMVELRTGKSFDKLLASYMNDLDSIVGGHIAKTPQAQKGDKEPPQVPRARKYYEKVLLIKNQKQAPTMEQFEDYSRVMLCLYCAALQREGEMIENFNFSTTCIDPEAVLMAMNKEETSSILPPTKKKRFNLSDPYGTDTFTLFVTILMVYTIVDQGVEEPLEEVQEEAQEGEEESLSDSYGEEDFDLREDWEELLDPEEDWEEDFDLEEDLKEKKQEPEEETREEVPQGAEQVPFVCQEASSKEGERALEEGKLCEPEKSQETTQPEEGRDLNKNQEGGEEDERS